MQTAVILDSVVRVVVKLMLSALFMEPRHQPVAVSMFQIMSHRDDTVKTSLEICPVSSVLCDTMSPVQCEVLSVHCGASCQTAALTTFLISALLTNIHFIVDKFPDLIYFCVLGRVNFNFHLQTDETFQSWLTLKNHHPQAFCA